MDYSRNWLYLNKKKQEKIKKVNIVLIGLGIGSYIAESLVRIGFQNITIIDGDIVEESNLNRQNYITEDIGKPKVKSLKKRLLKINPELKIKDYNLFLDKKSMGILKEYDYIINTIDFDSDIFLKCNSFCRKYQLKEFFPINLGFGSGVIFFKGKSPSIKNQICKNNKNIKQIFFEYIVNSSSNIYLSKKYKKYKKKVKTYNCDPQLIVSSLLTASMISSMIIKDIFGKKNKVFPLIKFVFLR